MLKVLFSLIDIINHIFLLKIYIFVILQWLNFKVRNMALVGKKFPNKVDAISKSGENQRINILDEAVNKSDKVLLFWYPKDFTFVCPTELHAFQAALEEFKKETLL